MHPKTKNLIEAITEATEEGIVSWRADKKPDSYIVDFGMYSVKAESKFVNLMGEIEPVNNVVVSIVETFGGVIEEINATKTSIQDVEEGMDYRLLRKLYDTAVRSALHIDTAYNNIINIINEKRDLPF